MANQEHPGLDRPIPYANEPSQVDPPPRGEDVSLVGMVNVLLRQRSLVLLVFLFIMGGSVITALLRPTVYTSSGSFVAKSSQSSVNPALMLAQEFGVTVGAGGGERSPYFYVNLITSKEVLRQTVTDTYNFSTTNETGDLMIYYEVDEETSEQSIELATRDLREDLTVTSDNVTGIVTFSVTTSDPVLSQGIAARILEIINVFDLTTRRTQASEERQFSEDRLVELTDELRQAEDSLAVFYIANRSFENSPVLQFEHDRLQRVVGMRQELVTTVAQSFEQARIEEVRNTPVITVLAPPRVPAFRDAKRRVLILFLGVLLGGMLSLLVAYVVDYFQQARVRDPKEMEKFSSLWRETVRDVAGRIRRPFGRTTL